MNRVTARAVDILMRALVLALTGVALAGCVPVNGGAVELSWTVRTQDGKAADCVRGTDIIGEVALCARACAVIRDGVCVGDETCPVETWPCERLHGSTAFEIVAGRKELWIEVTCPDGSPANATVPEPIVRDIADGEVTQLNAVLISVPAQGAACPTGS